MERDHHVELTDGGKYNFNSHAHVERDAWRWFREPNTLDFNSHAHVERDDVIIIFNILSHNFNSHAHVERDCGVALRAISDAEFQLTRSRGA